MKLIHAHARSSNRISISSRPRMLLIFIYVILSVMLAISAGVHAGLLTGIAYAGGSLLAISSGGGLRANLLGPPKQKIFGSLIAAVLLAAGLWVGTHFSAQFFGVNVSGPVWVCIGAAIVFLFVDKKMLRP